LAESSVLTGEILEVITTKEYGKYCFWV
jgi:hypothetical protein